LDAEDDRPRQPVGPLEPLLDGLDRLLMAVEGALRGERAEGALPDLRAAHESVERAPPPGDEGRALLLQLDEIVDAADTLAAVLGLDPSDPDREPGAVRAEG
jgi:hypothetical protein